MKQGLKRVRMYHPWKKDSEGNRAIQEINKRTVDTGMAAKLGYLPVPIAEAPPAEAPPAEAPPTEAPPTEAPPTEAPPTEATPTDYTKPAKPAKPKP